MSKNRLIILLIDDDPLRKEDAKVLGCKYMYYDGEETFFKELNNQIRENKPHLVIIDHKLDKRGVSSLPKYGLSIAQYIREKLANCPIIGFSADLQVLTGSIFQSNYEQELVYDDSFPLDYVQNSFDKLRALARDFNELRTRATRIRTFDGIMNVIVAPKEDRELLKETLPNSILDSLNKRKKMDILIFAKWIRKLLMANPGFLYGSLDAATHVGINEKTFLRPKIQNLFKKAIYTGLFTKSSPNKLWWASILRKIVFERTTIWEADYSWEAGRGIIEGLYKANYSRCFKCKKFYPETVGFIELSSNKREPLHLACSEPHPYRKTLRFLDEPRMMIKD